MDLHIQTF